MIKTKNNVQFDNSVLGEPWKALPIFTNTVPCIHWIQFCTTILILGCYVEQQQQKKNLAFGGFKIKEGSKLI